MLFFKARLKPLCIASTAQNERKSGRCDSYHGQVLEEEVPFTYLSWKANRSALWGVLCVVDERMKEYYMKQVGQDLRQKADSAARYFVQGQ